MPAYAFGFGDPCLPTPVKVAPSGPMWFDAPGRVAFAHACALGLEGILSKRRDAPYLHGRCRSWLKVKNPASPAALRLWEDRF